MKLKNLLKLLDDPYAEQKLAKKFLSFYYARKSKYYYLKRRRFLKKAVDLISSEETFETCRSSLIKYHSVNTSEFRRLFADDKTDILQHAEYILENRYHILGSGLQKLTEFNWHTDFKTGYTWEKGKFYKSYKKVDLHNTADVKYPWELSRGHQYLILGQAYLLTGDEKYAGKFISDLNDWIAENPYMASINWTCTMEVAIRAVNWIYALAMFRESPNLKRDFMQKLFTSLYLHGCFIYRNPEKSSHNNHNHYISDLSGQICLGLFFDGKGESADWVKNGQYELFREIRYQILPSGVDYEKSINYHRLVLELLSYTLFGLMKWNKQIPADILFRMEKMFEFVMYYTKPNGSAPIIGDQDDGRFLPFSINKNVDHRYILSPAAYYFNRSDFKDHSGGFNQECYFLLGPHAARFFDKEPDDSSCLKSIAYKDAGFYILRNETDYLFINNSGKGRYSEIPSGTHTHSDLLSFELYCGDKDFIIDPGTYVYSASPADRMKFRSTAMHNTVVVDKRNQHTLKKENLWDFKGNAIPLLLQWDLNDKTEIFEGCHSAYSGLNDPVIHKRKIVYHKEDHVWEITDSFAGNGSHEFDWFLHFDEGIKLVTENESSVVTVCEGTNIRITHTYEGPASLRIFEDFISKEYGKKIPALVLVVNIQGNCPFEFSFKISKI